MSCHSILLVNDSCCSQISFKHRKAEFDFQLSVQQKFGSKTEFLWYTCQSKVQIRTQCHLKIQYTQGRLSCICKWRPSSKMSQTFVCSICDLVWSSLKLLQEFCASCSDKSQWLHRLYQATYFHCRTVASLRSSKNSDLCEVDWRQDSQKVALPPFIRRAICSSYQMPSVLLWVYQLQASSPAPVQLNF